MIRLILLVLTIYSFWNPVLGSIIFITFATLFNAWVYFTHYSGGGRMNLDSFNDQEKVVLKKYPLFFQYTFAARSTSGVASGIYLLGIILAIYLFWNQMWIYGSLVLINSLLSMSIQSKLNPQHFLHDAVEKRNKTEFYDEMMAVDSAIKKIADDYRILKK